MTYQVGDPIPEWIMQSVSAEKMKTMAAILRDPNPLHWDREAVNAIPLNLGRRTINQGPLGLSYIVNMLHAWMGPRCLRRLVMRFPQVVLDDDQVVAKGIITALNDDGDALVAQCKVSLEHEVRGVLLEGEATVLLVRERRVAEKLLATVSPGAVKTYRNAVRDFCAGQWSSANQGEAD